MKRSLSCIMILILIVMTFAACGASSGRYAPAASSAAAAEYSDSARGEQDYSENQDAQTEGTVPLPLITPSNAEGSKIVYTVDMQLQTTTFAEGTKNLLHVVSEMNGYVQSTYVQGRGIYDYNVERSASYTLRIPSENLAVFLSAMEDSYNLLKLEQESQNISSQYYETDSQLDSLKEQADRLMSTLSETQNTDDKLAVERELARVQAEINSLSASVGGMNSAVIYSTVTIHLYEVIPPEIVDDSPEPFIARFNQTAYGSWYGFVGFWQGVLLFLIAALPVIIVLAVIGAIVLLVLRYTKKKGKKLPEWFGNQIRYGDSHTPPYNPPAQPFINEQGPIDDDSVK